MYYTYIHYRESDNLPFYVGKGTGKRAYVRTQRNTRWHRTVRKHGLKVEIIARWETESEAFEHERFLIACHRSLGYDLCNLTDGGEGPSGLRLKPRSDEHARKISEALRGRSLSIEQRKKLSLAASSRKHSESTKAKIKRAATDHSMIPHIRESRSQKQIGSLNHASKRVLCLTTGEVFGSVREAARHQSNTSRSLNSIRVSIALCCAGAQDSTLGMRWAFVQEGGGDD